MTPTFVWNSRFSGMDAAQHVCRSYLNERHWAPGHKEPLTNERLSGATVRASNVSRIDSIDKRVPAGIVDVIFTGDQIFTPRQFIHPRTSSNYKYTVSSGAWQKICKPVVSVA